MTPIPEIFAAISISLMLIAALASAANDVLGAIGLALVGAAFLTGASVARYQEITTHRPIIELGTIGDVPASRIEFSRRNSPHKD